MPKNIVICCDGTNNEIVGNQTNVLRLFRMLVRDSNQIAFYDAGVGTEVDPTAQWPWRRLIRKRLDAAIGESIRANVLEGYQFLVHHWEDGDKVFLFGFSRGAYTVRALAAMIKRCGLLLPNHANLAEYAWSVFTDEDQSGIRTDIFAGPARIKKVFSREVVIHLVGVWDTVSSFGWIWDLLTIPNTAANDSILHIRHAISIDEKRCCFQPNRFRPLPGQDCKELWFAGVHADVGGGYPDKKAGLARIALKWMLREAKALDLRIDNDHEKELLDKMGTPEISDELAPHHDESTKPGWRLVGWLPRRAYNSAREKYVWYWPNCAKRRILNEGALIHRSVESRMNDPNLKYKPTLPIKFEFED